MNYDIILLTCISQWGHSSMEGYLTIKDAARRLDMKDGALLRRVQRGSVKGQKMGWVWLVHENEVNRLIELKNSGKGSHDNR